ncbi:MAG: adenylyl-sulfate kinase [Nitrososphaerales archaeon]
MKRRDASSVHDNERLERESIGELEMNDGFVIWLTGLPGSGKTTIARVLQPKLKKLGLRVELLDGDEVRKQLSPDLGFTKEDRELHARRVVYLSKLLARNGIVAMVSLISPYRSFRAFARQEIGNFVEVYVKCSINTCIKRDPKGLYKKALTGEIVDLTGLQDPYEEPIDPEVIVNTELEKPEQSAAKILHTLRDLGYLTDVVLSWPKILEDRELRHLIMEHTTF